MVKFSRSRDQYHSRIDGAITFITQHLAAPLVTALAERTGATTKQYLYGQGDSPLAVYTGTLSGVEGWTYLSGRDGLNSVRQETDASGNVLTARSFDPYGVPLQGNAGQPFGYTGEQTDNTGLVFLRARYMQPTLGMFLSHDPWSGNVQWPGSMNGWDYAEGNPVRYTDPSGLIAQTDAKEAEDILGRLQPYGITIDKDWGMRMDWTSCDRWNLGSWDIDDLRKVETAIHQFDDASNFGGAARFKSAIQGHAKIHRSSDNNRAGFSLPSGDVVLTNYIFQGWPQPEYTEYSVIHELGHIWDYRTGNALSWGLMHALGTWLSTGGVSGYWNPYANAELPPGANSVVR